MPSQLYGRVEQEPGGTAAAKVPDQAQQLGLGTSSIAGSQQAANSPYSNFEDIFNKNSNYANQAAKETVDKVAKPLGDLQGRTQQVIPQTLAPRGHAAALNLPGYGGQAPAPAQAQAPAAPQAQTLAGLQNRSDIMRGFGSSPSTGVNQQALESPETRPNAPLGTTDTRGVAADAKPNVTTRGPTPQEDLYAQILGKEGADATQTKQELDNLGKYQKASDQLASYENDEGLDLMKQDHPGATIWDAGLMNQGGGRDAFDSLNSIFGGYDQTYMNKIAGDQDARKAELGRMNADLANQLNPPATEGATLNPTDPGPGVTGTKTPWGYGSYTELMSDGGVGTDIRDTAHGVAQYTDLASWFLNDLGKAGIYKGSTTSEMFRKGVGLGGDELDMQNMRLAFNLIERKYGKEAAEWLFQNMGEGNWGALKGMNHGAMYNNLSQMLEQGDTLKQLKDKKIADSEGSQEDMDKAREAAYAAGKGEQYDDAARNDAYRDGWGEEWDRQFRSGNKSPRRSNK